MNDTKCLEEISNFNCTKTTALNSEYLQYVFGSYKVMKGVEIIYGYYPRKHRRGNLAGNK